MKNPSLGERIERSAFAQRPIWFSLLCGFAGLLYAGTGFLLTISLFQGAATGSDMPFQNIFFSGLTCAAGTAGVVALWKYRTQALVIWPIIFVGSLAMHLLKPGDSVASVGLPGLLMSVALAVHRRLN